jgi:hypothetical protein
MFMFHGVNDSTRSLYYIYRSRIDMVGVQAPYKIDLKTPPQSKLLDTRFRLVLKHLSCGLFSNQTSKPIIRRDKPDL